MPELLTDADGHVLTQDGYAALDTPACREACCGGESCGPLPCCPLLIGSSLCGATPTPVATLGGRINAELRAASAQSTARPVVPWEAFNRPCFLGDCVESIRRSAVWRERLEACVVSDPRGLGCVATIVRHTVTLEQTGSVTLYRYDAAGTLIRRTLSLDFTGEWDALAPPPLSELLASVDPGARPYVLASGNTTGSGAPALLFAGSGPALSFGRASVNFQQGVTVTPPNGSLGALGQFSSPVGYTPWIEERRGNLGPFSGCPVGARESTAQIGQFGTATIEQSYEVGNTIGPESASVTFRWREAGRDFTGFDAESTIDARLDLGYAACSDPPPPPGGLYQVAAVCCGTPPVVWAPINAVAGNQCRTVPVSGGCVSFGPLAGPIVQGPPPGGVLVLETLPDPAPETESCCACCGQFGAGQCRGAARFRGRRYFGQGDCDRPDEGSARGVCCSTLERRSGRWYRRTEFDTITRVEECTWDGPRGACTIRNYRAEIFGGQTSVIVDETVVEEIPCEEMWPRQADVAGGWICERLLGLGALQVEIQAYSATAALSWRNADPSFNLRAQEAFLEASIGRDPSCPAERCGFGLLGGGEGLTIVGSGCGGCFGQLPREVEVY